ncbi:hypothetical protein JKF63_06984 [Porcisia hertigi]|uniref:Uncharacterized protein n=1 Tax=Porcisia hertigi TaxID=2761500 RepID=A0A836IDE2_9TRYP|nr:hypothetical protein JKF63_06984 [Porcisia hertigi]
MAATTACGPSKTALGPHSGKAYQSATPTASMSGVETIRMPPAPHPCIYAALIPTRAQPPGNNNSGASDVGPQAATASPSHGATFSAAGVVGVSQHDDFTKLPLPATECIAAPDLSATEKRHLALWTRSTPASSAPRALPHVPVTSFNDPLHKRWRERQTLRLHQRYRAALAEDLNQTLEQAVRRLLTAEEHHWKIEVQLQQERNVGTRLERSTGSPVPPHKMAALLQAVQIVLHQTSISFIEAQYVKATEACVITLETTRGGENLDAEQQQSGDGDGGGPYNMSSPSMEKEEAEAHEALSRAQYQEVLQAVLNTERELIKEVKRPVPKALPPSAGVSVVTLPSDLPVPAPVLRLEAAVSAALLSSIIEHAVLNAPGMDFAGRLLEQYILPHMYAGYAGWGAVRPQLGTLSEQVTHLAALPLRVQQQQSLTEAAVQARGDANYLQKVVKSYTMRAWLHQVITQRRYLARLDATERVVARRWRRVHMQRIFTAWRHDTQRERQHLREAQMKEMYMNFLNESKLSAQRDSNACGGTAVAMATALLVGGPKASASSVANMWSSCQHRQLESLRGRRQLDAGSLKERPRAAILATDSSTKGDTCAEWALVPSGTQGKSPRESLSPTRSRPHHEGHSVRRKGVGHSRVNLSIIRRKTGNQTSGKQHRRGSEETDMMERYVVCDDRSDDSEHEVGGDEEGSSMNGSGTLTQLVYLESPVNNNAEGDNWPTDGYSTRPLIHAAQTINASVANSSMDPSSGTGDVPGKSLFQEMLAKLQEMDQVNAYLRSELAVQSRRLRKVEAANRGLSERNRELEDGTLQLLREKLQALNTAQEQLLIIKEKNRRLRHLRSRLRAHRHRPWQSTVLRVVGDMCGASTAKAEIADEARVHADRYGTGSSSEDIDGCEDESREASLGGRMRTSFAQETADWQGGPATMPVKRRSRSYSAAAPNIEDNEERLFGRIAPIVLQSCSQLPDALVILTDWANSCLDELESLDDVKDGPFSDRFSSFNEEARSGVLISRLLYYLALPRYRTMRSAAEVSSFRNDMVTSDPVGTRLVGSHYRRQLLEQESVQLNPPFPVYADCFGDLIEAQPVERMSQLLAFATELMAGQDVSEKQDEVWGTSNTKSGNNDGQALVDSRLTIAEESDAKRLLRAAAPPQPTPSGPLPLQSVVDPYAIVRGETSAIVTLIALLYVRFAHPFHHKSRQCAKRERIALLQLWSGGQAATAEMGGTLSDSPKKDVGGSANPPETPTTSERALPPDRYSFEDDMLRKLPSEEKTAWQLFRERCLPIFGTQAHPFLLRGGFWPSDAFESPELASMLSSLAMALRRSLELHRWHITLSCLVPVRTYSGLSRGVFTGPCASAQALLLGLRQDSKEHLSVDQPPILQCVKQRQQSYRDALAHEPSTASLTSMDDGTPQLKPPQHELMDPTNETESLTDAISSVWQRDLLSLFVQRATLSTQLALPVLDLGSWRLLCSDLGLIGMASPDIDSVGRSYTAAPKKNELDQSQNPLVSLCPQQPMPQLEEVDMEVVTDIFQHAVMVVALARNEVDPAVLQPTRAAGDASSQATSTSPRKHGEGERRKYRIQQQILPDIQMDMTYASFVVAMVLLAHRLYPALSPVTSMNVKPIPPNLSHDTPECSAFSDSEDSPLVQIDSSPLGGAEADRSRLALRSKSTYCSLREAFQWMMQVIVLPSTAAHLQTTDPRFIIHHLTRGVKTQAVLQNLAPALLLVYQAYSREVFGEPGMVRDDVLRLLRDAMLTSTELSNHLTSDLFSSCSVLRHANEEAAIAKRKELDRLVQVNNSLGKVSSPMRRPGYCAVRIVDSAVTTDSAATRGTHRKRIHVLTYEGFCDLLCVLCNFKQPNVFVPFEVRLLTFVNRSLLRPLLHTVPNLAPLVSRSQISGVSSSTLLVPDAGKGGSGNNDPILSGAGGGNSGAIGAHNSFRR